MSHAPAYSHHLPHHLQGLVPQTNLRRLLLGGSLILGIGFGGMGAWAALAPLHSAVVAAGNLAPETGRKTVRHSEGGVIGRMLVHGGDQVKAGQVLIRLDATEAETRLEVLNAQQIETSALEARLSAELFEEPAITWPPSARSQARGGAGVTGAVENQQKLFDVRRAERAASTAVLEERIATQGEAARSLREQRALLARERGLAEEEVRITQGLYDRGNATRTKLVELQKEVARLLAQDAELDSRIIQSRQQVVEAKSEIATRRHDFREKVLIEREKARGELAKISEQIRDAANRLAVRDIKAPDAGVVVMNGHPTDGGIIAANEPILDIVPNDRRLLAEVRVQPKDIKSVTLGLPVKVQMVAYDSRVVGSVEGTVEYVSADRLSDPATHQDYYLTRIRLTDGDAHTVNSLAIKAGMPVEARILLGGRTPFDYLTQPLSRAYLKAFIQE